MVSTTTPYPPHPLTVGAAPATIWGTLLLLRLALPVIIFAVWVPMLARHHADVAFLSTALAAGVPVLIVWMIISNRLRAALNMRVPGAMRSYSWDEPGPGPRPADFATSGLVCVVTVGSLVTAALVASSRDEGAGTVTALFLAYIGALLLVLSMWRCVVTVLDRLPFWGREIGLDVIGRVVPGLVATIAAYWVVPASSSVVTGWFGVILVLAVGFRAAVASVRPRRGTSQRAADATGHGRRRGTFVVGYRDSVRKTIESMAEEGADMILARAVASPSLDDRQRAHRAARVVIYGIPLVVGMVVLLTGALLSAVL